MIPDFGPNTEIKSLSFTDHARSNKQAIGTFAQDIGASLGKYAVSDLEDYNEWSAGGSIAMYTVAGAAAGSVVPIIGTAIGAALGAVAGTIDTIINYEEFKREQAKIRNTNRRASSDLVKVTQRTLGAQSRDLRGQKSQMYHAFKVGAFSAQSASLLRDAGARWAYVQEQPGGASNELLQEAITSSVTRVENVIEGAAIARLQKVAVLQSLESNAKAASEVSMADAISLYSKDKDILGKKRLASATKYAEKQQERLEAYSDLLDW